MNEEATEQTEAEEDPWAEALQEQAEGEAAQAVEETAPEAEAKPQELDQLSDTSAQGGEVNLEAILDIPLTISMEIGSTKISIRNLLQLNQGSVVELDRLAGEPLDVIVNGTLIAHGEVVVVNEKFGIRLTDVVSPAERIKNLR